MIFTHLGHSMFLLETDDGHRLVTDPVDASSGYDIAPLKADAVLVSHKHHDHCAVQVVTGHPMVIDTAGTATVGDTRITAIRGWHDDAQGAKRGETLLFLIEDQGLRAVHLGDLGCLPNAGQIAALAPVDVLMVPVGGFFTIDAAKAQETARLLKARVIIPMHYRTEQTEDWPIAPVDDFLARFNPGDISRLPLARITKGDVSCFRHVVVLQDKPGAEQ